MPQSDGQVQNVDFPAFRTDLNDNLAALFSQSSGASAPAVTQPFQPWIDTSSDPAVWKVRHPTNPTTWITIGTIDATTFSTGGVTAIANGGTGQTTATAALTALLPSQAGNAGKALVTDGSLAAWGSSGFQAALATAVASTSGTSIDFTGIPSWAKRITVMLKGVSLSGTSNYLLQVGSGSFATTGYASGAVSVSVSTAGTTNGSATTITTGIIAGGYTNTAASVAHGHVVFTNIDGNTWVASGTLFAEGALRVANFAGSIALSGTLDRVRITTVNGTDTFDAGTINILYEG